MNKKPSNNSNLEAAVRQVAESTNLSIQPLEKEDDGPSNASVLIRTTDKDRERWREAAARSNTTLSAWIRDILNAEAKNILECSHPMNMIRFYPWSQTCLQCGKRLK